MARFIKDKNNRIFDTEWYGIFCRCFKRSDNYHFFSFLRTIKK